MILFVNSEQKHRKRPISKTDPEKQPQDNRGIKPGQYIIRHDAPSPGYPLEPSYGKWFQDIECTEEEKTQNCFHQAEGDKSHGDEVAHDLIDNHRPRIFFAPEDLRLMRSPDTQQKYGEDDAHLEGDVQFYY